MCFCHDPCLSSHAVSRRRSPHTLATCRSETRTQAAALLRTTQRRFSTDRAAVTATVVARATSTPATTAPVDTGNCAVATYLPFVELIATTPPARLGIHGTGRSPRICQLSLGVPSCKLPGDCSV